MYKYICVETDSFTVSICVKNGKRFKADSIDKNL